MTVSIVDLRAQMAELMDDVKPADCTAGELSQIIDALVSARHRMRGGGVIRLPVGRKPHRRMRGRAASSLVACAVQERKANDGHPRKDKPTSG